MKFRVSARAPHGVGALLLIGGAAVVGAAVLAWRRSRRGKKGAENHREHRQPAKDTVLDGGVVEDEKVQGGALVQKLGQPNENLSAGNTEIGFGRLVGKATEKSHQFHKNNEIDGKATEESHQIRMDNEIVVDHLDSKPEEKIEQNSGRGPVEITDDMDKEYVGKTDHNSSRNHAEITTHDMCHDNEHAEKIDHIKRIDQNSTSNPVEIIMQEMVTVCLLSGNIEKVDEDSIKNVIKKEIAQKDNKDVEAADQSKLSINGPGIIFSKNNDESDGAQEPESMENTPTAQLMMNQEQLLDEMVTDQEQLLDDMVTDTVTGTEEEKQGERTITNESELEQDEKKALVGLVELVSSPAVSSLVKSAEKKGPEFPILNETGMKIEQDYTDGELREHNLISKGGEMQGGAIATMDRRSPTLTILALIFAMTIGITIIVRLYAPTRATKLQMDM
ncbi:hypothetical protein BAE44_0005186 [Dichanthelium oligosanthes]|uniref:Uncharacterized protein n=1 Tax=Dichanthelium oligosanthes TaxID=888268 RepID=A0A1E5W990_9POAL|nr:hypothetical protein BAE44_0005186 [Dichanthelium oligosanthes]